MKIRSLAFAAALGLAISGCTTPVGPVEVTRFHDPASLARLGEGSIVIEPAPGFAGDADSLEFGTYRTAVGVELQRVGYDYRRDGPSAQVAQLKIERFGFQPQRDGSPVTVGGGGSVGSYGSSVGIGVGIDLSGPPPEQVTTEMQVMIRDRATGATLWEGRASFTVRADAPLAQTQLGAAKMASALFQGFPGRNGETIAVP